MKSGDLFKCLLEGPPEQPGVFEASCYTKKVLAKVHKVRGDEWVRPEDLVISFSFETDLCRKKHEEHLMRGADFRKYFVPLEPRAQEILYALGRISWGKGRRRMQPWKNLPGTELMRSTLTPGPVVPLDPMYGPVETGPVMPPEPKEEQPIDTRSMDDGEFWKEFEE